MKTVCFDARLLGPWGIGTYLENLFPFLRKAPFRLQALVKPEDADRLKQEEGIEAIPMQGRIYSVAEQLKLPVMIPPCDLFWSPHYNIPLLPIRAAKRLVTIHDVYHLAYYSTLTPLQKVYAKVGMQAAVRLSDYVITDSSFSKKELIRFTRIPEKKIQVIPLGVNLESFQSKDQGDESLLAEYRLPKQFFLFVGHRPHKNLKGLLVAFDLLSKEGWGDLSLIVIGKRDHKGEAALDLVARFPHLQQKVQFVGNVPREHLAAFYRKALALVFPSFYEGFGLPPLEAMSSGCPVVVSSSASLPEVCGNAALYVDPYSSADIAQKMEKMLKDSVLREELKVKGMNQSQTFSWTVCAEQHLKAMEILLNY
ncbi:MAG: glycosyltransferase family 4 protein [Ignavibacteriae bacterium]|nr:glycosyltransferase family 4 protein [Ignavibacteriota bacterium]